jgi:hypothetical protein
MKRALVSAALVSAALVVLASSALMAQDARPRTLRFDYAACEKAVTSLYAHRLMNQDRKMGWELAEAKQRAGECTILRKGAKVYVMGSVWLDGIKMSCARPNGQTQCLWAPLQER